MIKYEFENNNGCKAENQNMLFILFSIRVGNVDGLSFWIHSEVFRCHNGNSLLSERLLKKIKVINYSNAHNDLMVMQNGATIHFNADVSKINVEGNKCKVYYGKEEIECDQVVLQAPLTVVNHKLNNSMSKNFIEKF